ncbi:unnamed protein product [Macrosiphum euphorbiae]|uniref:Uncharacterized protein n=1 Tax=Macrosiphum euphorbiae TaxID=13131 RepID=A0AAV0Y7D1_9HEMI|nr:unnamed protein product [Macrosiphum euphorbiae]
MFFLKKKTEKIVVKLNEHNIKLIAPDFNWFTAGRNEIIKLLNSISEEQLKVLIDSQEKIELKNFEGNSEALDNQEVEFLDSALSEIEFEVFENGKLGKLPNIKKDRLEKILSEQFGQITINYSAEKLRDLARSLIKEKIENRNKENSTGNQFPEVKLLETAENHNLLEWSYSQIAGDSSALANSLTHKLPKEIGKMDFKKIIHRPDYFGGKSSEDIECFIEKFE